MMKKLFLTLSLVIGFSFSAYSQELPEGYDPVEFGGPERLVIDSGDENFEFQVEIAETGEQKTRGMMFRTEMDPETGMLFKYPENDYASIWMRNTALSLDVIFVRSDGSIAKIVHEAVPYSEVSMLSDVPVTAVLELAGGRSAELGIEPGDILEHPYFNNVDEE